MYIFKNSLKNILRNKGRNALVAVVLIIVMVSTTLSLSLHALSGEMISEYQSGFGVETRIAMDWEYAETHAQTAETVLPDGSVETTSTFEAEEISMQKYDEFANSRYVKEAVLAGSTFFVSDCLQAIPLDDELMRLEGMTVDELMKAWELTSVEQLYEIYTEEELDDMASWKKGVIGQIWGYTKIEQSVDFAEGKRKVIEGRYCENEGEVIVGEKFAELNGIQIGDTISVSGGKKTDEGNYKLIVVGIYTDYAAKINSGDIWLGVGVNDIVVSYDTLCNMQFDGVFPISDEIKYYLTNADAPDAFLSELREKGLPESYILQSDLESYNAIVEPVEKMSSIATTFGLVVLTVGIVIVVFLSVMNIRERKYEIGVLRAIGMGKGKIAKGMIYESVILSGLCTFLEAPVGYLLSRVVAPMMLNAGIETNTIVALRPELLAIIVLVACLMAVISSVIGVLFIVRYEPLRILSEQN